MEERSLLRMVRDFLFSTANKEFLIFLFFLALSGIFWLFMTLDETYEQEVVMRSWTNMVRLLLQLCSTAFQSVPLNWRVTKQQSSTELLSHTVRADTRIWDFLLPRKSST